MSKTAHDRMLEHELTAAALSSNRLNYSDALQTIDALTLLLLLKKHSFILLKESLSVIVEEQMS